MTGELRASAPLTLVGEVVITGQVTVTTAALHALLAHDIPLVLLSSAGRALGRLEPPTAPHIPARTRQLDLHRDPEARLAVAREMVIGKIYNQAVLLRRRARRSRDPEQVWGAVSRLSALEQAAGSAVRLPELLSIDTLALDALARFANFASFGDRTANGMGHIQLHPPPAAKRPGSHPPKRNR